MNNCDILWCVFPFLDDTNIFTCSLVNQKWEGVANIDHKRCKKAADKKKREYPAWDNLISTWKLENPVPRRRQYAELCRQTSEAVSACANRVSVKHHKHISPMYMFALDYRRQNGSCGNMRMPELITYLTPKYDELDADCKYMYTTLADKARRLFKEP